jgi:hypothetical protein
MESHLGVDRNGRVWHQRNSHTWYETAVRPQKHIRTAIRLSDTAGAKPYVCETYSWLLSSQGFLQHFSGIILRPFLTIMVSKRPLNQQRMYIIPTEHNVFPHRAGRTPELATQPKIPHVIRLTFFNHLPCHQFALKILKDA